MKFTVINHLKGYCVAIDGIRLLRVFKIKKNAVAQARNLRKIAKAVEKKMKNALL